jgi:hypothetical protein
MSIDPHTSLVLNWTAGVFPEPALILLLRGPTAQYRLRLACISYADETALTVSSRDLLEGLKHITWSRRRPHVRSDVELRPRTTHCSLVPKGHAHGPPDADPVARSGGGCRAARTARGRALLAAMATRWPGVLYTHGQPCTDPRRQWRGGLSRRASSTGTCSACCVRNAPGVATKSGLLR